MIKQRPVWLVVNSASGSNEPESVERLRAAFAEAGAAPDRVVDVSDHCPTRENLASEGVARLAIFAGDGTVNGLVTSLGGWDGEVLVLPGGTANLLARALHGEREAYEIAAGLDALRPTRRQAISCSAGTALIEVLAGPGAMWSEVREGLRDRDIAQITASGVEAVKQSAAGPSVRIVDPPLGNPEGYAGVRLAPEDGGMAVSGYGADNLGDYLRHGLALLKRDYREGPHDELGMAQALTCRTDAGEPIALMIDGERKDGRAEERFSLAPLDVTLLAS